MIDCDDYPLGVEIILKIKDGLNYSSEDWDNPEYHIVLFPSESGSGSMISYHLTKFSGKSRALTRFETLQLWKKLRSLTLPLPVSPGYPPEADPPMPWYQLIIKYKGTVVDTSWDSAYFHEYDDPPISAQQLVDLIGEIEPLDYEGLGIIPQRLL